MDAIRAHVKCSDDSREQRINIESILWATNYNIMRYTDMNKYRTVHIMKKYQAFYNWVILSQIV